MLNIESPNNVAWMLGVSIEELRKMDDNGELPPKITMVTKTVGYRNEDITNMVEGNFKFPHIIADEVEENKPNKK